MFARRALALALVALLVPVVGAAQPASQAPVLAETSVRFAIGSAELAPDARASLERFKEAVSGASELHVLVEGHADATGSEARNEQLSRLRAEAVAAHLESLGLDDARVEVRWYGSRRPTAPGDTPEAHDENRRVEVRARGVVRPVEEPVVASAPRAQSAPEETPAVVDEPEPEPEPEDDAEPSSADPEGEPLAAADDDDRPEGTDAPPPSDEPAVAPPAATEKPAVATASAPGISPWWAAAPAVVGLLAAAGATGFFVDYALNAGRLDQDRAELARDDLLPGTRSAVQDHAATLEGALLTDLVAGGVLATAAAAAFVTTGVLLLVAGDDSAVGGDE